MNTLSERIASLPPDKRELLERRLGAKKNAPADERIQPRVRPENAAPLSFAQQRLWFLDQLEPGLSLYNLPFAFPLNGRISVPVLERCFNEIVRRHEVLRTTFSTEVGRPIQVVHPEMRIALPVIDLTDQRPEDRETEAARLAALEAATPFDLRTDAMVRASLLKLGETRHVMLVTMHHIASDGWSLGVFFRELTALYEAFSRGMPSPLPPLAIQYADFAVWQRSRLQGARLEKLLKYWLSRLAGAPAVLALPSDRPRPEIQDFRGAAYAVNIPKRIVDAAKRVAREADATLFMALLAAFKTLLFRYTGVTDLVVGSPTANRTRVELEDLIGFFVNPLVLRTDLSGNPSFLEVLGRVREVTLEAYAHQELPFERLVEEIQPERSLSHNPLFQVAFVLQNIEKDAAAGPGNDSPQFRLGTSKFDLTLSATETTDGVTALFEYDSRLFDQPTIAQLAGNFCALLDEVSSEPGREITAVLILEESRRRQLGGEATQSVRPKYSLVHEMFEAQAKRTPNNTAVESMGESLTYDELDRRANRVARTLRQRGLLTGDVVGICVERSFEMIVAVLAVLKAGGAYLPLDPAYPPDRLEYMLDESQTKLILTREELRSCLPIRSRDAVCLIGDWGVSADVSAEKVTLDPPPELAYVIYTSGSTGRPKGVMVAHAGLCNSIEAQERFFQLDESHRVLQFASLNFDASIFEMIMAWHCGATLCLAPQPELMPGNPLARFLREQRISLMVIPPSALEVVPATPLPDLRVVVAAGEACPATLVSRWASGRRMFNAYGPTEISIWCAAAQCEDDGLPPPIGKPILNARAYVLDHSLQPVPVGVPGELYVGGPGVARGYLGRAELTAERFLPDPFVNVPEARMYRTGDRVRWRADGQLQYLGRVDRQLKLRGYRIELGEIEHEMLQHPGVIAAAADVAGGPSGNPVLTGYLVERPGSRVDPAELREMLRRKLPKYMVPAGFVRLETLPLNSSGKLDRHALQRLQAHADGGLNKNWVAPTNETEETIAQIWASVLAVDRIGIHQGFFDLGGHSLLATRVTSRLSEAFAIDLPLRAIFEFPTVAELAREVEKLRSTRPPGEEVELVARSRQLTMVPTDVR